MSIHFPFSPKTISQSDLERFLALSNQARRLVRMRDAAGAELLHRLIEGAPVEPGIHTAEIVTTTSGVGRLQRLAVR
jgi:hypothetical protein